MKSNFLLPHQFKKTGLFLFVSGIILGVFLLIKQSGFDFLNVTVFAIAEQSPFDGSTNYLSLLENNILDEIIGILIITGGLLIAFSKEKTEDEFISKIRLESLVWATYLNYFILILSIIFVYNIAFFWILVFNMFTVLGFFIIRFSWVIYKTKNQIGDEE
ncbi:MAG TPA: hypothetical protein VHO46_01555 [Bacteroidales bacterium]|nr:hypothetical protein [Bacteroidales bacterium]